MQPLTQNQISEKYFKVIAKSMSVFFALSPQEKKVYFVVKPLFTCAVGPTTFFAINQFLEEEKLGLSLIPIGLLTAEAGINYIRFRRLKKEYDFIDKRLLGLLVPYAGLLGVYIGSGVAMSSISNIEQCLQKKYIFNKDLGDQLYKRCKEDKGECKELVNQGSSFCRSGFNETAERFNCEPLTDDKKIKKVVIYCKRDDAERKPHFYKLPIENYSSYFCSSFGEWPVEPYRGMSATFPVNCQKLGSHQSDKTNGEILLRDKTVKVLNSYKIQNKNNYGHEVNFNNSSKFIMTEVVLISFIVLAFFAICLKSITTVYVGARISKKQSGEKAQAMIDNYPEGVTVNTPLL